MNSPGKACSYPVQARASPREVDSLSEYKETDEDQGRNKQSEYEYASNTLSTGFKYVQAGPFPNQSTKNWFLVDRNGAGGIPIIPRPAMPPPSVVMEMQRRRKIPNNAAYNILQDLPKQFSPHDAHRSQSPQQQRIGRDQEGSKKMNAMNGFKSNYGNNLRTLPSNFRTQHSVVTSRGVGDESQNFVQTMKKTPQFKTLQPSHPPLHLNDTRRDDILKEHKKRNDILQHQIRVVQYWRDEKYNLLRKYSEKDKKYQSTISTQNDTNSYHQAAKDQQQCGYNISSGHCFEEETREETFNEVSISREDARVNCGADDVIGGWVEYWDEEVGASYYYNTSTGEASWVDPTETKV
mmetsp:Transcript_37621/g.55100  ORF Transcript_37621/g.55100 Transcript_37621/m.55100 type:complete len:351 (+) Transcript_37621:241-1293(+)